MELHSCTLKLMIKKSTLQPFLVKNVEPCPCLKIGCRYPILKMGVNNYQSARNIGICVYGDTLNNLTKLTKNNIDI